MTELNEHLVRVQDIAARAQNFQVNEGSDPKVFSKAVVSDLAVLAEAVAVLLKRVDA